MLDKVKNALRVKTPAFDEEINDLINACIADLRLVGIRVSDDPVVDPLILRAVILYAKGHFGRTADGEKYLKAYEYLKCSLSLAGDYRVE